MLNELLYFDSEIREVMLAREGAWTATLIHPVSFRGCSINCDFLVHPMRRLSARANRHDDEKKKSSWKRDGEKVLTINYGKENGRNLDEIPSRRIRAKSVHACSREFYFLSLSFFPSFFLFFFIFSISLFFLRVHICVYIYVCFSPLFVLFSPFLSFFLLFLFNRPSEERGITRNEIANRATSQRSGCVSFSRQATQPTERICSASSFFSFLSYLSALYRVCTCVCVCVKPAAASLEKLWNN